MSCVRFRERHEVMEPLFVLRLLFKFGSDNTFIFLLNTFCAHVLTPCTQSLCKVWLVMTGEYSFNN